MRHRKVRAQLPSPTRQVKRTHDARECLKALLDKDAATPYQTGAVQSFRDTGANRERFASEPGSAGPELRAKSLGVLGLIIPPRVRADPFAARRSQALRASPQWVRAKARWYEAAWACPKEWHESWGVWKDRPRHDDASQPGLLPARQYAAERNRSIETAARER